MVRVQRVFSVDRPMETVVDYLKDFSHAEEWDPGTISCHRLDSGPVKVGSGWHNVSKFNGRQTQLEYRLIQMENDHLVFQGRNKTATSTDDMVFTSLRDGTSIAYLADIRFHGVVRLLDPFFKRPFEKLADETVASMTDALLRLSR
jgi:carbon monoxide dehydrogenase subunit G